SSEQLIRMVWLREPGIRALSNRIGPDLLELSRHHHHLRSLLFSCSKFNAESASREVTDVIEREQDAVHDGRDTSRSFVECHGSLGLAGHAVQHLYQFS